MVWKSRCLAIEWQRLLVNAKDTTEGRCKCPTYSHMCDNSSAGRLSKPKVLLDMVVLKLDEVARTRREWGDRSRFQGHRTSQVLQYPANSCSAVDLAHILRANFKSKSLCHPSLGYSFQRLIDSKLSED